MLSPCCTSELMSALSAAQGHGHTCAHMCNQIHQHAGCDGLMVIASSHYIHPPPFGVDTATAMCFLWTRRACLQDAPHPGGRAHTLSHREPEAGSQCLLLFFPGAFPHVGCFSETQPIQADLKRRGGQSCGSELSLRVQLARSAQAAACWLPGEFRELALSQERQRK